MIADSDRAYKSFCTSTYCRPPLRFRLLVFNWHLIPSFIFPELFRSKALQNQKTGTKRPEFDEVKTHRYSPPAGPFSSTVRLQNPIPARFFSAFSIRVATRSRAAGPPLTKFAEKHARGTAGLQAEGRRDLPPPPGMGIGGGGAGEFCIILQNSWSHRPRLPSSRGHE